jgi:biotin-dependent carboxylase-like uncharacterized protein
MIEILATGLLSSLQDHGRIGQAHLGIGRSGAADLPAMTLANALVGNAPQACALEMTLQGPRLRLHQSTTIALAGAPMPKASCNGVPLPMWRPVTCQAGSEIRFGAMRSGCRSYLAVAGGFDVEAWLGSRSTDLNAGLGPLGGRALREGDELPLGPAGCVPGDPVHWSLDPGPWFNDDATPHVLRLLAGSHTPELDDASRQALETREFRISADSNRVGVRIQSDVPLKLRDHLELVSEGTVPGVMQLPPGGQPILLLNEHPVTGGYPRIAQLAAVDLPRLAQCRPGDRLHFTWIKLEQAHAMFERSKQSLELLMDQIARRLENRE